VADGIIWNERELFVLLESEQGVVGRDLVRRALRVHAGAVQRCPVGSPESTGIKGYVGGTLRSSLTWELVSEGGGLSAKVGTNVEYAPFVELGTRYMKAQPYLVPALQEAT
jgi:HK97 gp10 family phage protein